MWLSEKHTTELNTQYEPDNLSIFIVENIVRLSLSILFNCFHIIIVKYLTASVLHLLVCFECTDELKYTIYSSFIYETTPWDQ